MFELELHNLLIHNQYHIIRNYNLAMTKDCFDVIFFSDFVFQVFSLHIESMQLKPDVE